MLQTLEERKQELRDTLKKSLVPRAESFFVLSSKQYPHHESTWAIANTFPYYQSSIEVFEVRNNPRQAFVGFFMLAFVPCIAFLGVVYNYPGVILFILFLIWIGTKQVVAGRDKKTKLCIDKRGIFYHEWSSYIEWKNIISTYIKESEHGEDIQTTLLIFYHDVEDNMFKQKEASIEGLKRDTREISFFVEFIKMKAGFPTLPSYY